jgi:hypothetical protein
MTTKSEFGRVFKLDSPLVVVYRVREAGELFYEAEAPDGFCFIEPCGGMVWSVCGATSTDCTARVIAAAVVACDDADDLEDEDTQALILANSRMPRYLANIGV